MDYRGYVMIPIAEGDDYDKIYSEVIDAIAMSFPDEASIAEVYIEEVE